MIELPAEPMLAAPADTFALLLNWFAEPKWTASGLPARAADGSSVLRSRWGSEPAAALRKITDAGRLD
ncbi:hypothetical protein [Streptomyces sp. NPDC056160]|uniref:hypothetical protein n=1 Tax=Streptomyces sp. NPDC056160 TaxID=3345731 RepID=UPI0035E1C6DD